MFWIRTIFSDQRSYKNKFQLECARVKQRHTPIVDINEQRMTYSLYSLIRQGNLTLQSPSRSLS